MENPVIALASKGGKTTSFKLICPKMLVRFNPFPTYNKSVADDFEIIQAKIWKKSKNENIILNIVENIVIKEKIARCHNGFKILSAAQPSESVYMWERIKDNMIEISLQSGSSNIDWFKNMTISRR